MMIICKIFFKKLYDLIEKFARKIKTFKQRDLSKSVGDKSPTYNQKDDIGLCKILKCNTNTTNNIQSLCNREKGPM